MEIQKKIDQNKDNSLKLSFLEFLKEQTDNYAHIMQFRLKTPLKENILDYQDTFHEYCSSLGFAYSIAIGVNRGMWIKEHQRDVLTNYLYVTYLLYKIYIESIRYFDYDKNDHSYHHSSWGKEKYHVYLKKHASFIDFITIMKIINNYGDYECKECISDLMKICNVLYNEYIRYVDDCILKRIISDYDDNKTKTKWENYIVNCRGSWETKFQDILDEMYKDDLIQLWVAEYNKNEEPQLEKEWIKYLIFHFCIGNITYEDREYNPYVNKLSEEIKYTFKYDSNHTILECTNYEIILEIRNYFCRIFYKYFYYLHKCWTEMKKEKQPKDLISEAMKLLDDYINQQMEKGLTGRYLLMPYAGGLEAGVVPPMTAKAFKERYNIKEDISSTWSDYFGAGKTKKHFEEFETAPFKDAFILLKEHLFANSTLQ